MDKVVLTVKNHTFRGKGDFHISEIGIMSPKTRNSAIWGSIEAGFLPDIIFKDQHFVVPTEGRRMKDGRPITLSAFYKFSKSNFNVFAEYLGAKLASHFNTKTSYNCPAIIDKEESSIYDALTQIPESKNNSHGSLVLSMLGPNDKLFSFAYVLGKSEPVSDVRFMFKAIKDFVFSNEPDKKTAEVLVSQFQREFAYQYLFRDCFGDVDFTSKNSGMIKNEETKQISLAPQFDFGELLNTLYRAKICEPKLDRIENYPEHIRSNAIIEMIKRVNENAIKENEAPASEVAQKSTFGEESFKNISNICGKYPDIVAYFLQDIQNFQNGETNISELVENCAIQNNEELINSEQREHVSLFLQERLKVYSENLQEGMETFGPKDYLKNFFSNQQKSTVQDDAPVQ